MGLVDVLHPAFDGYVRPRNGGVGIGAASALHAVARLHFPVVGDRSAARYRWIRHIDYDRLGFVLNSRGYKETLAES